jgi:GT2 family glycosyltransferase
MPSRFVVLLDADDKIGANYLYEAERILAGGADVVNPDAILFGAESSLWNTPDWSTLPALLHHNSVHYCAAFRRELWSAVGGIDEEMPCWMDYDFWIRIAARGAKIRGIHGEHFFYRQHESNLTNAANNMRRELRAHIEKKHADLFRQVR